MQQDTSEAFSFITGQLELPLLTLKMDLYHTGREEPNDDHKFVNERLLEVAILSEPLEGSAVVTLEDCLENYFNNRIEVKRHLERNRGNTLQSIQTDAEASSSTSYNSDEKTSATYVETIDVGEGEMIETPLAEISDSPASPRSQVERLRPGLGRSRADSIFSERRVPQLNRETTTSSDEKSNGPSRHASVRKEVLMPAWQFFKLLPWYTDNMPTSDAQVAAHFSHKRPVLGIALKRYQVSNDGVASRLDTYVDIPLEIAVPKFVSDDNMADDSPLVGNFKLVLQSVVCHRGTSVSSGHYVSLVRGQAANAKDRRSFDIHRPGSPDSDDDSDPWMLFDDLAKERVTYIDINQKLREECPYLLFYQVQPIDELPPTYEESCSRIPSDASSPPEKLRLLSSFSEGDEADNFASDTVVVEDDSRAPTSPNGAPATNIEAIDWSTSTRASTDISQLLDERGRQPPRDVRGRTSTSSARRPSIGYEDAPPGTAIGIKGATSVPSTPLDESRMSFLGLPISRRGSKANISKSKSRPNSQGADDRASRFGIGFGMSKLSSIGRSPSRNDLASMGKPADEVAIKSSPPTLGSEKFEESATKHTSFPSVSGSVGSLGEQVPGGSTESLGSKSESIAIAELTEDHRKKNWKEKMEMKRGERSRIREEKHKDKEGREEKHHKEGRHGSSGKKIKKEKNGEVPERECVVM